MKRNTKLTLLTLLYMTIFFSMLITSQAKKDDSSLVEHMKNLKDVREQLDNLKDKDKIVLEIGDRKISEKDYQLAKAMLNNTVQDVEEHIIKKSLVKIIAKQKGINVEQSEVLAYIESMKTQINNANDIQSKQIIELFFETYGFDKNTFWESVEAYDMYYDYLLVAKLRQSILQDVIKEKDKEELTNDNYNILVDQKIENLITETRNKISIKKY